MRKTILFLSMVFIGSGLSGQVDTSMSWQELDSITKTQKSPSSEEAVSPSSVAVPAPASDSAVTDSLPKMPPFRRHALGINAGLQGLGADYAFRISRGVSVRLRGMWLNYGIENFEYSIDDQNVYIDANIDQQQIDLIFDFYPSQKSSFKFMVGGSYFLSNTADITINLKDTLFIGDDGPDPDDRGDFIFYPDDIGGITLDATWNQFAPYVGIGFGRAVPKKRVGFAVELGTFYIGQLDLEGSSTGLMEITEAEEAELEENLSSLNWYPQLNFRLSIKL